jgi:hypothetical protein
MGRGPLSRREADRILRDEERGNVFETLRRLPADGVE